MKMIVCPACGLKGPSEDFQDGCARCEMARDMTVEELEREGIMFFCIPSIPPEPGWSAGELNEIIAETRGV